PDCTLPAAVLPLPPWLWARLIMTIRTEVWIGSRNYGRRKDCANSRVMQGILAPVGSEAHTVVQRSHVDAIVRLFDAGVGVVVIAHPHFRAAGEFQPGAQAILELEFTPQILVIQVGLGEVGRAYAALEEGCNPAVAGTEVQPKHGRQRQAGGIQTAPTGHTGIPIAIQLHAAGLALPQGATELDLRSDPVGSGIFG